MGGPYLESGESIVLTTDRVSVDNITYDALLTTRRLILTDMRYARFEPRTLSLAAIESVRSGKAATGEPVILLALKGDGSNQPDQRVLVFLQEPLENRKIDRDLWVRKFIELSISDREPVEGENLPPAEPKEGMQPSVRRWVAPEIVRPRPDLFGKNESSKRIVVMEEELPKTPEPVRVEIVPAPSEGQTARIPHRESDPDNPAGSRQEQGESMEPGIGENTPGADPAPDNYLSRSILAATQSLIAAKAREELAHPPQQTRVRTTSALPETPQKTHADTPANPPVPLAESVPVVRTTSPVPEILPEPAPVVHEPAEPASGIPDLPAPEPDTPEPPVPESRAAAPPAAPPRKEKDAVPPGPEYAAEPAAPVTLAGIPSQYILAGIIACLLVLVAAFMLLHGMPQQDAGTTTIPNVITPVATVPVITVVSPTAPAEDDLSGVRVRISSDGYYTGEAGNPAFLQPVSGPGTVLVKPLYSDRPVMVRVEKDGNDGGDLTIAILKDGRTIATRSTSAPRGSVELLIDPVTEKPPGLVTTVPTTDTSRVGKGKLEYY